MNDYADICKRLRNRRICIQATGGLDDFPLLTEAADTIAQLSVKVERLERARNAAEENRERMEKLAVEMELKWHIAEGQIPKWVSAEERLPSEPCRCLVYVHAYNNVKNEPFFQELGCDGSYIDYLEFDDRQKVWQNGQYDAYNAVLSAVDKDNSYYISHWMMPPKKPEEPPVMFYPQVDGITPTLITPEEDRH